MTPTLLRPSDVAVMCQICEKTVYRAIERSELKASRLGESGAYRIRPEWLRDWIEARRVRQQHTGQPTGVATLRRAGDRQSQRGKVSVA